MECSGLVFEITKEIDDESDINEAERDINDTNDSKLIIKDNFKQIAGNRMEQLLPNV
jgi:hypothetical protein